MHIYIHIIMSYLHGLIEGDVIGATETTFFASISAKGRSYEMNDLQVVTRVCMYVCMHECMQVCIYIYIYTDIHIHI